jgi:CRISPR-associated protein Cas1
MKLLLLTGHGINIRIDGARLCIKDGAHNATEAPQNYVFLPRRMDVEHIVLYGQSGNLTIDAIQWLIKHNVQITLLDWNGKLLTTMLPAESVQVKTKQAQYRANADKDMRLKVAQSFLEAKFAHTQLILDYLKTRYPNVSTDFSKETALFRKAHSINEMMMVEGRIAAHYWRQYNKILPDTLGFEGRSFHKPRGAGDTVNCLLNYGYAILEAECRKAISNAGLDPFLGFLHEHHTGTSSLAYDLQEPYRFLIDLAVLDLIENKLIDKSDLIRTENYSLRLLPTGAKKLIAAIDAQLDRKVPYRNQEWSWRYIIQEKTTHLAQYLLGKREQLDFIEPHKAIQRQDTDNQRQQILNISYAEWKKLGFSKGTLHYLKKNAESDKPFTMNAHVRERIRTLYPEIVLQKTEKSP